MGVVGGVGRLRRLPPGRWLVLPRRLSSVSVAAGVGALVSVPGGGAGVRRASTPSAGPRPSRSAPLAAVDDRLARVHRRSARPPSPCSPCRASSPPAPTSCTAPAACLARARRCAPRSRSREHPPPRRPRAGRQRRRRRRAVVLRLGPPRRARPTSRSRSASPARARDSATSGSPLAGYAVVRASSDARLSGGLAGLVGVAVVGPGHGRAASSSCGAARRGARAEVGSGHSAHLHVDGTTPLHRMPAHAKLVGLVAFVLLVVSVPPQAPPRPLVAPAARRRGRAAEHPGAGAPPACRGWPSSCRSSCSRCCCRSSPSGRRSRSGRSRCRRPVSTRPWRCCSRAPAGCVVAVAFAVTTRPRDLVRALQHLRVPDTLVTIAGFMVRYVDVVGDQMRRMRVARASRGFTARSVRAWPPLAASTGRALHPQLRAGRAGAPRDGQPRLVGPDAGHRAARRDPGPVGARPGARGRRRRRARVGVRLG